MTAPLDATDLDRLAAALARCLASWWLAQERRLSSDVIGRDADASEEEVHEVALSGSDQLESEAVK